MVYVCVFVCVFQPVIPLIMCFFVYLAIAAMHVVSRVIDDL